MDKKLFCKCNIVIGRYKKGYGHRGHERARKKRSLKALERDRERSGISRSHGQRCRLRIVKPTFWG